MLDFLGRCEYWALFFFVFLLCLPHDTPKEYPPAWGMDYGSPVFLISDGLKAYVEVMMPIWQLLMVNDGRGVVLFGCSSTFLPALSLLTTYPPFSKCNDSGLYRRQAY